MAIAAGEGCVGSHRRSLLRDARRSPRPPPRPQADRHPRRRHARASRDPLALKGSRLITHVRRLAPGDALTAFTRRVRPLGDGLAYVLWQLPPTLQRDLPLLEGFLDALPDDLRHVVEFRHPSWLVPSVLDVLSARGVTTCWVSSLRMSPETPMTGDLVALRLHGLRGGFAHDYTDAELAPWVERLTAADAAGHEAYAFFDNDGEGRAPENARRSIELLRGAAMPWPPKRAEPPDGS